MQEAVTEANPGAIINIFAGIPATVSAPIDVNAYIQRACYFVGTSGSTMDDIRAVLDKVSAGSLDTNLSVAAVSGMGGARSKGLRRLKLVLLPSSRGLGHRPFTAVTGVRIP